MAVELTDTEKILGIVAEFGIAVVISQGSECTCGPGHCWLREGIGGFGCRCRSKPSPIENAPPCPHCGAPWQGTEASTGRLLCWRCAEYHEAPFRILPDDLYQEPWTGMEAEKERYRIALQQCDEEGS